MNNSVHRYTTSPVHYTLNLAGYRTKQSACLVIDEGLFVYSNHYFVNQRNDPADVFHILEILVCDLFRSHWDWSLRPAGRVFQV
jgi:hypothetical protein